MKASYHIFNILFGGEHTVMGADYFEGTVMIDGMAHTLSCSCDQPIKTQVVSSADLPFISPSVCETISTTTVVEEKVLPGDAGLSADDISAYYGQPRQIQISNDQTAEFQCADSRWTTEQAFTLGGDLGEFILVTNVIDGLSSAPLTTEAIGQALLSWLQLSRTLTFCTDRASLSSINSQLGRSIDLNSPPDAAVDSIVAALSQSPELHGDVFWKCVIGNPANYKIRKDLIKAFLNGFFQIHWSKDRVVSSGIKIHSGYQKPNAIIRNGESKKVLQKFEIDFRAEL